MFCSPSPSLSWHYVPNIRFGRRGKYQINYELRRRYDDDDDDDALSDAESVCCRHHGQLQVPDA